jgi:hypothetical protein
MDEFGGQGLSIIGVTGEGKKPTEKWVADKGARYPYAYEKGSDLQRAVGLRGYPHAALIDPSGTIVWTGHPARLDRATIETALAGALSKPLFDWPDSLSSASTNFARGAYGKALIAARKVAEKGDEGVAEVVASLESFTAFQVDRAAAWVAEGNYLPLDNRGKQMLAALKGLPELEERLETLLGELKSKEAKRVLKGQRAVLKLKEDAASINNIKRKDVDKLLDKLEKLRADYAGTYAERDADKLLEELTALRKALKR